MLKVKPKRRKLLKERYEAGKIAALNNESATTLKNENGNYCLFGAMMTDEEIVQRTTLTDKGYTNQFNSIFTLDSKLSTVSTDYPKIWTQHDNCVRTKDKTSLIERIKKVIETGVIVD